MTEVFGSDSAYSSASAPRRASSKSCAARNPKFRLGACGGVRPEDRGKSVWRGGFSSGTWLWDRTAGTATRV